METMSRTAKLLDKILAVIYWLAIVSSVIGILFAILILFVSLTNPSIMGMIDTSLNLGHVSLTLSGEAAPDIPLWCYLALAVFGVLSMPVYCVILATIRDILKPFINRQPFHDTVAKDLHRLSILVLINTVLNWIGEGITVYMALESNIEELLRSDVVRSVSVGYGLDLTPLLFAAALYLLSKVFLYGQELQTLSDETL